MQSATNKCELPRFFFFLVKQVLQKKEEKDHCYIYGMCLVGIDIFGSK